MRSHLTALDHGVMDPAPAPYLIRINGHLGATMLSAFPALAPHHRGTHTVLTGLHLISAPLPLLYNDGAVLIGLVYNFLPFFVLPMYATLERLDPALLEAAADLGARPLAVVWRVIVPVSAPGIAAGAVLVFIPCLGAYLTPDLLGGGKSVMLGNLIQNQFTTARDWPFGSAASLVLMLASALLLGLLMRSRVAKELM